MAIARIIFYYFLFCICFCFSAQAHQSEQEDKSSKDSISLQNDSLSTLTTETASLEEPKPSYLEKLASHKATPVVGIAILIMFFLQSVFGSLAKGVKEALDKDPEMPASEKIRSQTKSFLLQVYREYL